MGFERVRVCGMTVFASKARSVKRWRYEIDIWVVLQGQDATKGLLWWKAIK